MTDTRGLVKNGHWLKWADSYLAEWERMSARVPAVEERILSTRVAQVTANAEESFGVMPEAGVIVKVSWAADGADVYGQYYLINNGTAGTANATVASATASGTATAYKPQTLSLATASIAVPAAAGLSWKRVTTGGNGTLMAASVMVEYAPDITSQLAPIGEINANVRITRVTFTPDTTYTAGAMYLINQGTSGTALTTVASKTGATLTGGVPYTLTIDTDADDVTARQRLAFRRVTASGDKTMPGGKVDIEFALSRAEYGE